MSGDRSSDRSRSVRASEPLKRSRPRDTAPLASLVTRGSRLFQRGRVELIQRHSVDSSARNQRQDDNGYLRSDLRWTPRWGSWRRPWRRTWEWARRREWWGLWRGPSDGGERCRMPKLPQPQCGGRSFLSAMRHVAGAGRLQVLRRYTNGRRSVLRAMRQGHRLNIDLHMGRIGTRGDHRLSAPSGFSLVVAELHNIDRVDVGFSGGTTTGIGAGRVTPTVAFFAWGGIEPVVLGVSSGISSGGTSRASGRLMKR